ncbi:serine hydrolase FSH [Xylariaceae sp. FL1272]|nr:serine hydrolase FSH [Xylariaceae sp. FL1272]
MHFLCLHGAGSNAQTFETQTAALRYELGDHHTYEFVEGVLPCPMAPELEGIASPHDQEYYKYIDENEVDTCIAAIRNLDAYIAAEGPFDGILAFSEGAMVAATYIKWKAKQSGLNPLKCAVFLSAWNAVDPDFLMNEGKIEILKAGANIDSVSLPTAHIWGKKDVSAPNSSRVSELFSADLREIHEHVGAHEIPGPRMTADVKSSVRIIRRTITRGSRTVPRDEKLAS